ncbi:MAG: hypothetical protein KC657_37060 [Myxococcales bacterium]|nr:hypothetical protein [Myxococcales bacterium]
MSRISLRPRALASGSLRNACARGATLALAAVLAAAAACRGGGSDAPPPADAPDGGDAATGGPRWLGVEGERLAPPPPHQQAKTAHFTTHDACAQCHLSKDTTTLRDPKGRDISPVGRWKPTMMALAARDPYYVAAFADELEARPGLRSTVERTCARCHAPEASVEIDLESGRAPSFALMTAEVSPNAHIAREGVACTGCHQITSEGLGTFPSFTGGFAIGTSRLVYGPHDAPLTDPMRLIVDFTPFKSVHVLESSLCATCHTVVTRAPLPGGKQGPEFPEQVPYLEWKASAFRAEAPVGAKATTCQQCHMPSVDEDGQEIRSPLATTPPDLKARSPHARHAFLGANAYMLGVAAANDAWGATATPEELGAQAALQRAFLRSSAELRVNASREGDAGVVRVKITNATGHKLPTGYPSRRMWVHVKVARADGAALFESGRSDAFGRLVDRTGALVEPATFFPHFDVIDDDAKVQVYEAVPVNADGKVVHRPLDAITFGKDNRLLPQGFDKRHEWAAYTTPKGVDDDPSWGSEDEITYRVARAEPGARVEVRLVFQTIRPSDFEALAQKPTPAARRLFDMVSRTPPTPEVIAEATATIP